jgi:hypothetical protein
MGLARGTVLAAGRRPEHVCLLRQADVRVALHPCPRPVARAARHLVRGSLAHVLAVPGVVGEEAKPPRTG